MKKKLNIRGETLIETIIALSILAIGITIASTVILNSMRNLTNAKNRVIAINLAREGIEAMRNVRDTNWLYYSDRRRQCWNHDPSVATCEGTSPIPPGTYIVYKHTDQSWRLQLADTDLGNDSDGDTIPDNDLELVTLSLVDIDPTFDSDGLDPDSSGDGLDDDQDMYNHMNANVTMPLGTEIRPTPFSRFIIVEYLENEPDPTSAPSNVSVPNESINTLAEWTDVLTDPELLNRMRVTAVVSWQRGGATHTAELKTIITDHLGREDLAG